MGAPIPSPTLTLYMPNLMRKVIQVEEHGPCEHQHHKQQHRHPSGHSTYEVPILRPLRLLLIATVLEKLPAHVLVVVSSIIIAILQ